MHVETVNKKNSIRAFLTVMTGSQLLIAVYKF